MKRPVFVILLLMFVSGTPLAADMYLNRFQTGSYAQILKARQGQPFMLILWSTTCAPCREEFQILQDLQHQYGPLPVVLISTDDIADHEMIKEIQNFYGLAEYDSWAFAQNDAQRLRFEIDATWFGELPRSYFYDATHDRRGISGGIGKSQIEGWLETYMR